MDYLKEINETAEQLNRWMLAEKQAKLKTSELKERLKKLMFDAKQKKVNASGITAYFGNDTQYSVKTDLSASEVEKAIANGILSIKVATGKSDMALAHGYVEKKVIPDAKFTAKLLKI